MWRVLNLAVALAHAIETDGSEPFRAVRLNLHKDTYADDVINSTIDWSIVLQNVLEHPILYTNFLWMIQWFCCTSLLCCWVCTNRGPNKADIVVSE
ncbi:MAG: uncharacterized protein KVP18_000773 [Porospora cf. gigantea A]|uniref:uncharacterized protein n=1 Tax=Porospora cf. gigantea A TaxID=2853593 RepID=UPI003559BBD1|nr:MAG: hypothetical protein KVP18_000773 [Porospora cf. gigantea A]